MKLDTPYYINNDLYHTLIKKVGASELHENTVTYCALKVTTINIKKITRHRYLGSRPMTSRYCLRTI